MCQDHGGPIRGIRESDPRVHWAVIVVTGAVVFFSCLGATHLWDKDETIYGSCAREMYERGDWVVPVFNGHLFPDKPPLMYWLMISGFHLFGVGELGARFWSAILGIATALVTYHLGRRLFCPEVGFWAALVVATNLIFTVSARAATVDSALTAATALAIFFFVLSGAVRGDGRAVEAASNEHASTHGTSGRQRLSWLPLVGMYTAMAVAVLAKGPVGILLPLATIVLYRLVASRTPAGVVCSPERGYLAATGSWIVSVARPSNVWRALWPLRPLTGIAVLAVVAGPWFVLVGLRTDGVWLHKFFVEQNVARALNPMDNHGGAIWYYLPALLVGFFPWSVFVVPTLRHAARGAGGRDDSGQAGAILALCWLGVFLLFWSLVRTKLPHYILPAYPALALLTGYRLQSWLDRPQGMPRGWMLNATVTWMVVGVGLMVAMPILSDVFLPGESVLGLVGLVLLAGGLWCLVQGWQGRTLRMMAGMVTTAALFMVAVFALAAQRVDRYQNAPRLVAEIRQAHEDPVEMVAYRFFRESFVFYLGQPIRRYDDRRDLTAFLVKARRPYVLTTAEYAHEIQEAFPGELAVVARRPRFLKRGELVVLSRPY